MEPLVLAGLTLTAIAAISMALSLGDPNTAMRKLRGQARGAGTQEYARALGAHLVTLGNPDIQLKTFSGLQSADTVIADVGCVLLALFAKKPTASTVDSWLKGSNHATVAAANGDIVIFMAGTNGGGREYFPCFNDGLPFATGLTLGAHTTVNGNSKSLVADAPTGFAIIAAAL